MKTEREIKQILKSTIESKPENRLQQIKSDPRFVLPEKRSVFKIPKWGYGIAFAALLFAMSFPLQLWNPGVTVEKDPISVPDEVVLPDTTDPTTDIETPIVETKMLTSIVTLDINPSIRITLDQFGDVLSINAVNVDGEVVLANLALDGLTLGEAISLIIDEVYNQNYLTDQSAGVVLIGVETEDASIKDSISQKVEVIVQTKASENSQNVTVVVETFNQLVTDETVRITKAKSLLIEQLLLTGTYTVDDISTLVTESISSLKERIETEYGISISDVVAQTPDNELLKDKLIEEILEESTSYTVEQLANESIDSLKTILKAVHGIDDDKVKEEESYTSVLAYVEEKRIKEEAEYQEELAEIATEQLSIQAELASLEEQYQNASDEEKEKLLKEINKLQEELAELEVEIIEAEIEYMEELQEIDEEENEADSSVSQEAKDRKDQREKDDDADEESDEDSDEESDGDTDNETSDNQDVNITDQSDNNDEINNSSSNTNDEEDTNDESDNASPNTSSNEGHVADSSSSETDEESDNNSNDSSSGKSDSNSESTDDEADSNTKTDEKTDD